MLNWNDVRADWPNAEFSEFVAVGPVRWHVQHRGTADSQPMALFIHGSGASTHSWAEVCASLSDGCSWLAVDLPGHGFTEVPGDGESIRGPGGIATALGGLLEHLGVTPGLIVGHSAGAAIGLQLSITTSARTVLALTPSLGYALESRVERMLADLVGPIIRSEGAARTLAALARNTGAVDALLGRTGSVVPRGSRRCYRTLMGDPDHVRGVMRFFSEWEPEEALAVLPSVDAYVDCVLGAHDGWIAESEVRRTLGAVARRVFDKVVEIISPLAKNKDARYQSADAFAEELRIARR